MDIRILKKLFDQLEKCETAFQAGLFYAIFKFFPEARVEQAFFDEENTARLTKPSKNGRVLLGLRHHSYSWLFILSLRKSISVSSIRVGNT